MEQTDLLKFIATTLDELGVPYMVVGSYASGAYGDPRFTLDIDIVVDLKPAQLDALIARLPPEDFYISREAAHEAIRALGQFNVIHPESGNKIDFMIAREDPWGKEQLRRRVKLELLTGVDVFSARPEDVILAKLKCYKEGGSEKHMRDIASMFKVSGDEIDRAYIERWVDVLDVREQWQAVQQRLSG